MDRITFNDLDSYDEGLVFLGCGGDLTEWADGIRGVLEEAELVEKDKYTLADWKSLETTGGRVDLFFDIFKGDSKGDVGKLAIWRINFGDCSWLSDYKTNYKSHHKVKESRADKVLKVLRKSKQKFRKKKAYSGRGMFGRESELAVVMNRHPQSEIGEKLKKRGMAVDNFGKEFVYYFT